MITKNLKIFFFSLLFFAYQANILATETEIDALEISILDKGDKIIAKGSVKATTNNGYEINSDFATYDKKNKILNSRGNIILKDLKTLNKIIADEIEFHENQNKIYINKKSTIIINNYEIVASNVVINTIERTIQSENNLNLIDGYGHKVEMENFFFSNQMHQIKSKGLTKISDNENNKLYLENIIIDTKLKKIAGQNFKSIFNKEILGNKENDPRFLSNSVIISEENTILNSGVFTTCKIRNGKCPPWKMRAKKITHDKNKKQINYEKAWLDLYDIPIIYFQKFFHPDPTVKRQSGFLIPSFGDSNKLGSRITLPYYFALNDHKDLTIKPHIYINDKPVFQFEYRQKNKKTYTLLDTSFNESYKSKSSKDTQGSRTHFFLNSNTNLDFASFDQSNLEIDIQKTSNDTYLKVHGIDSDLTKNKNLLTSKVELDLIDENYFFNLKTQAVEDLTKNNDKYEYTLPFYHFGKELSYFTNYGSLNLDSQGYLKNYDTNKKEKLIVNDLSWSSINSYTANGFMNNFDIILKNTNYSSDNISELKSEKQNHELSGALAFTSSLPLRKTTSSSTKLLTPKIMFRTAPGHMNSLKDQDLRLDYSNLFSINKASNIRTVENGNSIAFGTSYLNQDSQKNANKFEASIGQVFNLDTNKDMPTKSTLNRKMSDLVGDIIWKVDENNLKYKFSLDHNYSELNYQEISSKLSLNRLVTEFSFIEERNVIGNENFLDTKINFEIDNTNSLNFSTRKNFKTDMTEFYNLMYEYENDCLIASIEYNRQFYTDRDIEPTNNLMFMIKFLPFGTIKSPSFGK